MERTLFAEEHILFGDAVRQLPRRACSSRARWCPTARRAGTRPAWSTARRGLDGRRGGEGTLCPALDAKYGGGGGDFLHSAIVIEELSRTYESGFAMPLHSDVVVPYLHEFGSEEQKQRWLPGCASGELVTAIAMTEPGTGSDLGGHRDARAIRDGDEYVIDGAKTFISNGILCDLCIVAAKTDNDPTRAHKSISLFVVEADRPGFVKGKKLKKMGMASQDTAELAFEGCRVPAENRLGEEGSGFAMLMSKLQQERLVVAVGAQAAAEQVLADTIASTASSARPSGKPIAEVPEHAIQARGVRHQGGGRAAPSWTRCSRRTSRASRS